MIQRFCFVKLLDPEVLRRAVLAERLRTELAAAGADAIVGLPADDSAARWDLSIVIAAPSLAAWHDLASSPPLIAILDDLAARSTVVKAWTFET